MRRHRALPGHKALHLCPDDHAGRCPAVGDNRPSTSASLGSLPLRDVEDVAC